jgi:hypothetical protein
MSIAEPEVYDAPPAPPAPPGPLPKRIVETFTSPGELFARFGENTPWVGPLLIACLVTAVMVAVIPLDALLEPTREAMRNNPDAPRDFDPARFGTISRVFGIIWGPIMMGLFTLITAGFLQAVFSFGMGSEATFKQTLGVVTHAGLIAALGVLIAIPIIFSTLDIRSQLALNLLAPGLDHKGIPYRFLSWLNIFTLWQLAVTGIGVAVTSRGKVSTGTAMGVIYGTFLLLAALSAVIGARLAA